MTDWVSKLVAGDSCIDSAAAIRFRSLCDQQTAYFYEVSKDPLLVRYARLVIAFDRRRSKAALLDAEDARGERDAGGEQDAATVTFCGALDLDKTLGVPKLSQWQQQYLLHPHANVRHILTDEQ